MEAGTGMEPSTFEPGEPAPAPRDPDTFELFEDEPAIAPESIPSPDEGAECAGGTAFDGDPSRISLGQVAP